MSYCICRPIYRVNLNPARPIISDGLHTRRNNARPDRNGAELSIFDGIVNSRKSCKSIRLNSNQFDGDGEGYTLSLSLSLSLSLQHLASESFRNHSDSFLPVRIGKFRLDYDSVDGLVAIRLGNLKLMTSHMESRSVSIQDSTQSIRLGGRTAGGGGGRACVCVCVCLCVRWEEGWR